MKYSSCSKIFCVRLLLVWCTSAFLRETTARLERTSAKRRISAPSTGTTIEDLKARTSEQNQRHMQQCNGQKTIDVYITLDLNPSDIKYSVKCDNGNTYLQSQNFNSRNAYQSFHNHACLPQGQTCVFTITDSRQDGLTAGNGGKFEVWEDGQLINSYNHGPAFQVYTVCCGNNCDQYEQTLPPLTVARQEVQQPPCDIEMINHQLHPEFYVCQDVALTFHFDDAPGQTGYKLQCDDGRGWNRPPGTYQKSQARTTIGEKVHCVERSTTCSFTVYDKKGNGLNGGSWFKLVYGETSVADYSGGGQRFTQMGYCIGPKCSSAMGSGGGDFSMASAGDGMDVQSSAQQIEPLPTNSDVMDNGACSQQVQLFLTVDEFPNEIGYKLDCGSLGELWNKPFGSFSESDAFGSFQETACLDAAPSECCTFIIQDSFGDGLTSPDDNIPGNFELRVNSRNVASYDGSNPNAEFDMLNFFVGPGC